MFLLFFWETQTLLFLTLRGFEILARIRGLGGRSPAETARLNAKGWEGYRRLPVFEFWKALSPIPLY